MSDSSKRAAAGLAALLTILCVASFFIPAFIIRPFRYQSPRALALAMYVKTLAPMIAAAGFAVLLLVALRLWKALPVAGRVVLVIAVLLSGASAVMTRLNYFEWMFRPIAAAGFVAPDKAHLKDAEMVMTVTEGTESRAYPIRQMAYHHVLNDTVAGVPLVVTY